jgi:hypothetical protein
MFYIYNDGFLQSSLSVDGTNIHLVVIDKDTYQYPIQGWYWFDTLEEAKTFFNIQD